MAGSVNKAILIGNLGRDPEIRSTQDGTKIANFSVATSESWRDRSTGEREQPSQDPGQKRRGQTGQLAHDQARGKEDPDTDHVAGDEPPGVDRSQDPPQRHVVSALKRGLPIRASAG